MLDELIAHALVTVTVTIIVFVVVMACDVRGTSKIAMAAPMNAMARFTKLLPY